jgi:hypothetical protein
MWRCLLALTFLLSLPEAAAAQAADSDTHFKLLGPDWARIPEGYSGLTPTKIIAQLKIPKEYLNRQTTSGLTLSSISLAIAYPSMEGAAGAPSSDATVFAAIGAGEAALHRKGGKFFLSTGAWKREPTLDAGGLCGYVDREDPGYKGDEFYTACDEAERTFSIICFPEFNGRRVCSESAFLGGHIGAVLTYRHVILDNHRAMLDAMRKLVMSFVEPNPEDR